MDVLLLLDICSLDSTVLLQILFEILNIDAVDLGFQKVIIWPNLSIMELWLKVSSQQLSVS